MCIRDRLYQVGVTALLSWLASGQQGGMIVLGVSSFEMSVVVVGLMMLLLAHVLAEGCRLQAESDAFVCTCALPPCRLLSPWMKCSCAAR